MVSKQLHLEMVQIHELLANFFNLDPVWDTFTFANHSCPYAAWLNFASCHIAQKEGLTPEAKWRQFCSIFHIYGNTV